MEAWLTDWLGLLLRWAHFIVGIAWIGSSFYFNWLENHLQRRTATGAPGQHKPDDPETVEQQAADPIAGDLWAVHGGGFYYLQKYRVAPGQLPEPLHWFKYEAYFTWLTGFALLAVVYYWNASLYLLRPGPDAVSEWAGIAISLGALLLSWFLYDIACRSSLRFRPVLLGIVIFAWFTLLAFGLDAFFSGRAVYIHIGAAIGTIMAANVFFVIIPAQKELVNALEQQREPDASSGQSALLRSLHNNYLTLPVLFIMISNHYPFAYGSAYNLLFLMAFSIAAVGIRHWFNIRHRMNHNRWVLPLSLLIILGLAAATMPAVKRSASGDSVGGSADSTALASVPLTNEILPVVVSRCAGCHAEEPSRAGFNAPPLGMLLETVDQMEQHADAIYRVSVATRTMPLGNLTGMTEEERKQIDRWYMGRK